MKTCLYLIVLLCFMTSCNDDSEKISEFNTVLLIENIKKDDMEAVKKQVNVFLSKSYKDSDYKNSFDMMVDDLQNNDDIKLCNKCYKCIETNPEQSSIIFSINSKNITLQITISESISVGNNLYIECKKIQGICN